MMNLRQNKLLRSSQLYFNQISQRAGTKSAGFTLIEALVVAFIIGVLSTVILINYRTGQNEAILTRAASAFESDLRKTQNLALASTGEVQCGFGLHYLDNKNYLIYAGHLGGAPQCKTSVHNFQTGVDTIYQGIKIIEAGLIFKNSFSDIFYEPPNPDIYINENKSLGTSQLIEICLETDLTKCRSLTVDTAGRIVIQ